jgi:hypothetical protein
MPTVIGTFVTLVQSGCRSEALSCKEKSVQAAGQEMSAALVAVRTIRNTGGVSSSQSQSTVMELAPVENGRT